MHKSATFALTSLALVAACSDTMNLPSRPVVSMDAVAANAAGGGQPTGRHIVAFTGAIPADFSARVSALGGSVVWTSDETGLATVRGLTDAAAGQLAGSKGVQSVDADASFGLDLPSAISTAEADGAAAPHSASDPTTAVRYARQWNMRAVHADAAWAAGHLGSSSVHVYMLDSGIDYLHADLIGLVDLNASTDLLGTFDVGGVPFTEADTVAKYFPGRLPFTDLFFHGTHTGATVSSNAVRAAGISSHTTLVAVKVCSYLDICPFSSILNGVIYAAQNGADVINLSLGGSFSKAHNGRLVGFLNKVFNFAKSRGVTVVVSAGNSAADLDHDGNTYATFCDNPAAICVSATGPTAQASVNGPWTDVDAIAYYTNFGSSAISVAAPGGNNNTFVWAACSQTSLLVNCSSLPIFILGVQGTSMSAPHVSGTAALLVPELGRNPSQIRARIEKTADDLGKPGTDDFYGKGRLNTGRATGALP